MDTQKTVSCTLTLAVSGCVLGCLLLAVTCLLVPGIAHATSADVSARDDSEIELGMLSDRYETLNELSNALNSDENVVINTRVGVLTAVNRALDNTDVRFSGEVVSDVMNAADGYKWVNVMGAANTSIGVLMTDEQAALITNYGDYHATGTTLVITGTYHIACDAHQGELDVHAIDVEVSDAGSQTTHTVNSQRVLIGLVLSVVGIVLALVYVLLRRRADRKALS